MATQEFVEIETTFEVSADTSMPSAGDFAPLVPDSPMVHHLSATYFDTADFSLLRHKVTLRRRTGGDDAGWHLKLPAAAGRREVHAPLTDSETVPTDLVDAVAGLVRRRALTPVARIDNERHVTVLRDAAGTPVVEFCDDHVTTEAYLSSGGDRQWREWETELLDAAREDGMELLEAIEKACIAAGASRSSSASKLARALGPLPTGDTSQRSAIASALAADVEQMIDHDPGARQGTMVGVHQMRVAVRGLRSSIGSYATELEEPAHEHGLDLPAILGDLKELAAILGKVRDVQVVGERLAELYGNYPLDLVPQVTRDRIVTELDFEESRARVRASAALLSDRYLDLLDGLTTLVAAAEHAAHTPAVNEGRGPAKKKQDRDVVLRGVDRQFAKFTKARSRTERDLDSLDLTLAQREELTHVVRKRAKALRRNVNSLPKNSELTVAPLRTACNRLHTVLGDIQDSVTTREWLSRIVHRAEKAGESTFGLGVLYEHERGYSERALDGFESDAATVTAAYRELSESRRAARKRKHRKDGKKKK